MNLFEFNWQVPECAFEFREEVDGRRYLVPAMGGSREQRSYKPLDHRSLFRQFAELRDIAGFLDFANHYGPLLPIEPILLEELEGWYDQTEKMRNAIALWELCRTKDVETLSRFFSWQADSSGEAELFSRWPDSSSEDILLCLFASRYQAIPSIPVRRYVKAS